MEFSDTSVPGSGASHGGWAREASKHRRSRVVTHSRDSTTREDWGEDSIQDWQREEDCGGRGEWMEEGEAELGSVS